MSEHDPSAHAPEPQDSLMPEHAGFEPEGQPSAAKAPEKGASKAKSKGVSEFKANFNSVFGHGFGKAALILAGIFVVVFAAVGIRGLHKSDQSAQASAMDIPRAPRTKPSVEPVSQQEINRRNTVSAQEANAAETQGRTYQPAFIPAVSAEPQHPASAAAQPQIAGQPDPAAGMTPPQVPKNAPQGAAVQIALPASSPTQNHAEQQEQQRRQAEADKAAAARQKYEESVKKLVDARVSDLMGDKPGDGGIAGRATFTSVSYLPITHAGSGSAVADTSATAADPAASSGDAKKKPLFKAGHAIFATTDAEVNTDDGGEVFATVRGGPYDGAKLIGKIEQAPRNIRLHFTILAPQDDRPTLSINAIAIREQDAKQGVAETIDNHTLERYTALFAGSLLAGLGQAAAAPQGTTEVLPNGTTLLVQDNSLSNKRIAMYALGNVGTTAGGEVKKTFSEPPTYIVPANQGIGVVFMADVIPK
jgi:intracellular multiplication protein IcmE